MTRPSGSGKWRKGAPTQLEKLSLASGLAASAQAPKLTVATWRELVEHQSMREKRPKVSRNSSTGSFAVCVDNRGYEGSLELNKIYVVVPDVGVTISLWRGTLEVLFAIGFT